MNAQQVKLLKTYHININEKSDRFTLTAHGLAEPSIFDKSTAKNRTSDKEKLTVYKTDAFGGFNNTNHLPTLESQVNALIDGIAYHDNKQNFQHLTQNKNELLQKLQELA